MSCLRRNKTCIFASIFITFAITGSIIGVVVAQQAREEQQNPGSLLHRASVGSSAVPRSEDDPELSESDRQLLESLEMAREINSITSINEFLSKFSPGTFAAREPGSLGIAGIGITGRVVGTGTQRSNSVIPKPALCMPELQLVPLKQETDPSYIYYPTCTRIMRCGGCCNHQLLSCQPTEWETKNYEVAWMVYNPPDGYKYNGKRIIPLEEHTKCVCDCTIKEKDCTLKQTYKKDQCQCVCNNVDERDKCIKNNNTKIWNSKSCDCVCREEKDCSTGFYFDQNTCRCRQMPLSRGWFPLTKGTDYGFGQTQRPDTAPPVIISLDAGDPKRKPKPDPYT
ncbi:vascular endothelial growth factor C isoform X2 [Ceratina calcarata]|uniref:Vascular endothelial growth factor C isoform X1 n=1 Tax=Ceratina calcarata TaxID=156304 RepID=A0AAJ7J4H1_9HYME|nr:vascular endothelial growth factor C isoform X1 [Ceratina calcarata]XP_017884257.1 vascular endothelial growth factor C isoform X1 [Ceratina calcarata]XP_017884258.1 vascular endothelial growth factor C isoform X2 [Ceratina calcarata]XP_017884259.1 vascular endothelial growth factor C isoform X2 [Ceratina calcarata]XP_026671398.1 vascular endothelial growth factor C isoform X1 [Ceratina calcarata]XP_026671399.1 vascular endothelial growth factor C isoform X2 [Ceratina calcarata]